MGDHKNLADLLWGEDTDTESDAIEEAQGAALDRLNLDRAETFRKHTGRPRSLATGGRSWWPAASATTGSASWGP